MSLSEQRCDDCRPDTPPLTKSEANQLWREIPKWTLADTHLERELVFRDFRQAVEFVNAVADLAEGQKHHPDISVSYNKVRLTLSTHKIGGLSKNDFILAAKIDRLVERHP